MIDGSIVCPDAFDCMIDLLNHMPRGVRSYDRRLDQADQRIGTIAGKSPAIDRSQRDDIADAYWPKERQSWLCHVTIRSRQALMLPFHVPTLTERLAQDASKKTDRRAR